MSLSGMGLTQAQVLDARRRKVRKGTHSCWECRRRKIRCQFSSPDDAVCIGCRARGSACRSQEFSDETPSPPQQVPEKKVAQRLDRLETMMEQLMTHVMAGPPPPPQQNQYQADQHMGPDKSAAHAGHGQATQHTQDHQSHRHSTSGSPSVADGIGLTFNAENDCNECDAYIDTAYEQVSKVYKDPTDIVAHVCPTAAGKQGYGKLDVLEMSTAEDTPVAALLGIQDSLSNNSGGGVSGSGSSPNNHGTPSSSSNLHTRATAAAVSAVLGTSTDAILAGSGHSPGSMDVTGNSPNGGQGSAAGSSSQDVRGSANSSGSATSDTGGTTGTAATKDSTAPSASMLSTRSDDPVSEEWRRHRHLSRMLVSLFPSQEDMNTIAAYSPKHNFLSLFHSKHDIASGRCEPASKLREIPPMSLHPTAIARRLLQLTLCMQQMAPCFALQGKLQMKESLSAVINRIAGVVTHTVTSNDELIGSVEGLECLVLLGEQQSNTGQLRKAWLSYRRAMSLAQLMGLDRGNTRALKSCDPTSDARLRPTPAAMWYRINACDRYVSLLLGLRAGCQDDDVYPPSQQPGEKNSVEEDMDTPVEKLEKAHMIVAGRIIERNHSKISLEKSYDVTQAIDAELQAAASRNLGPTWWEVPSYDPSSRPDFIANEMSRAVLQIHHHCILILLHLPYMLRGEHPAATAAKMMAASSSAATSMCEGHGMGNIPTNVGNTPNDVGISPQRNEAMDESRSCSGGLAYSKATCLQSSRAVLKRFVTFRRLVNTAFSCRQVDYASLIAAMTLIIGYLGPRPTLDSDPNVLDAFDTQLRQDRAMVEQVRESMERLGKVNNDKLSRESAATIQQLMPILDLVAKKSESEVAAADADAGAGGGSNGHALSSQHLQNNFDASTSPTTKESNNYGHDGNMRNNTTSSHSGDTGVGAEAAAGAGSTGTPGAGTSSVRLNVPYFGTVNIHTNVTTGTSSMSPFYPQPPQTPYQQQQEQLQLHHELSEQPQTTSASLGVASAPTFSPDAITVPISYDLLSSPSAGHPVLDWGSHLPSQQQPHQQQQQQQQQQTSHQGSVDLNDMLVDFDPMPMSDDGDTTTSAPNGEGGGAPTSSDGLYGFGGVAAFPDMTGSSDDWVMQGVDTTYWSLLNGGGGSFGGQMG
ncbi:c6 zinc finger domain containing protein [Sporothrix brasiliensis 5110]|uniref:C6 zinc finger domain containing protein n=1 Tax=Sporothrix brasiliensis 5110 TaxID=1398154 RepID=A0A0C2IR69_9PEZI|nr:c6 zinc finger domain containing protein [Sporothrix brasiliensis 5110]KIH87522.1 c6 zinc finger domain containing protein [Sporothrix brasiliensis 5110]